MFKKKTLMGIVVMSALMLIANAQAITTLWITNQLDGTLVDQTRISVAPGSSATLHVFVNAEDSGNAFEVFLGYDKSYRETAGDGGPGVTEKLVMASTDAQIVGNINSLFPSGQYSGSATALEDFNYALGGRAFGKKVTGSATAAQSGTLLRLFTFTITNNSASIADPGYVVLSDAGTGTGYTTAWKNGTTSYRSSYLLQVIPEPTTLALLFLGGFTALLWQQRNSRRLCPCSI